MHRGIPFRFNQSESFFFAENVREVKYLKECALALSELNQLYLYCSESIRKKYDIVLKCGCLSTMNAKGAQFSTTTPVLRDWLESFDGIHPLMDIGCAYGINTLEALKLAIPTIALDTHQVHLDVVKQVADERAYDTLSCLLGSLPDDIPIPDESLSGALVSEVLHFLTGEQIGNSFHTVFKKLQKGGILAVSTMSVNSFRDVDSGFVRRFFQDKDEGIKWPGYYEAYDKIGAPKFEALARQEEIGVYNEVSNPKFMNLCILSQITEEVEKAGFEIIWAKEGQHPGYMCGMNLIPGSNIQVVARKPRQI